jgi:fatty acid desaturase
VAGNASSGQHASFGSWIACLIIIAGFALGGAAMIVWNWPMFWIAVGLVVLGCVMARAVHIMDDVTEYGGGHHVGGDPEPSS